MPLKLLRRGETWYLRGAVCGQQIYKSTKLTDRKLAEALRIRTEARMLDEHVYGTKAAVTFGEAVQSYLDTGAPARFVDRLERELGSHKLSSIGQADLDAAARRLYPDASPQTRNRQFFTPFIAVWNHAVGNEWADVKMWRRPRKPKGTNVARFATKRSGTGPVEYEHAAKFVAAMSPAPAMAMTTLFYSGLRPIELFALEAPEIDVAGRWIVLKSTKTGDPRGIPIHEFLVPLFESLLKRNSLAKNPRLFRTHKGKPYPAIENGGGGLKTAINGARRRSGIMDVSPYTGRHSCSTQLVINGVHPHIKDQILGHAADDMSRHYTNVPQAPLIEAINKLPVPDAWRALPWWKDPLAWSGKLVEGTGRRTDLERKRAQSSREAR